MSISEKLPLINSSNKLVKIIGYVIYAFLILIVLVAILPAAPDENLADASGDESSSSEKVNTKTLSVVVDGWNFSADLGDQWQSNSNTAEDDYFAGWTSRNTDYMLEHNNLISGDDPSYSNWEGVSLANAFWIPTGTNVANPEDLDMEDLLAAVDIKVFKVPEEVQNWDTQDILFDFYGPSAKDEDEEYIEFNGRPAYLNKWEPEDPPKWATLVVLISDDTIVQIEAGTNPESNLDPWDIIKKFTISPA